MIGECIEKLSFWIGAAQNNSSPNPYRILELSVWARELKLAQDLLSDGQSTVEVLGLAWQKLSELALPESKQAIDHIIYVGKVSGLRKVIEILEGHS